MSWDSKPSTPKRTRVSKNTIILTIIGVSVLAVAVIIYNVWGLLSNAGVRGTTIEKVEIPIRSEYKEPLLSNWNNVDESVNVESLAKLNGVGASLDALDESAWESLYEAEQNTVNYAPMPKYSGGVISDGLYYTGYLSYDALDSLHLAGIPTLSSPTLGLRVKTYGVDSQAPFVLVRNGIVKEYYELQNLEIIRFWKQNGGE